MPAINPGLKASGSPQPDTSRPDLALWGISKLMGTFHGWLMRKAVTLALVGAAAATAFIAGKWILLESLASRFGFSADTLAQLHAEGAQLVHLIGGIIATLVTGIAEATLSRIAAKVKEEPLAPVPPPV